MQKNVLKLVGNGFMQGSEMYEIAQQAKYRILEIVEVYKIGNR